MSRYAVALMMNEKRCTNSFKSYVDLDVHEQVMCTLVVYVLISFRLNIILKHLVTYSILSRIFTFQKNKYYLYIIGMCSIF